MTGQILAAFVATQSDLVARVGDRVRPLSADVPDIMPYLTYQEIDGQTPGAFDGPSGLADRRLQVNAVAATYGQCKLIARLLCGTEGDIRFDGFKGTVGGIDVRRSRLVDMRDFYDQPESAQVRGPYEIQMDFMIAFDEAAIPAADVEG